MKYLDRTLVVSPYHYGLCKTEKDFRKELKRLKVARDQWPDFMASGRADATAHFSQCGDVLIAIVCIGDQGERSDIEVYGLLVHEAVHIWQQIREELGENSPSDEFEAYSVQTIAQSLMQEYAA